MRSFLFAALVGVAHVVATAGVHARESGDDALQLKTVSALQVLSVKVGSLGEFPAAFAKLEEHCDREEAFRPLMRISLGGAREYYAAVTFEGAGRESPEVKLLELPPATVVTAIHRGSYYQLPAAVKRLMHAVTAAGYTPDESALLRLLHRTPPAADAAEPVTEIQIPVVTTN